jgi:hypothetical protein
MNVTAATLAKNLYNIIINQLHQECEPCNAPVHRNLSRSRVLSLILTQATLQDDLRSPGKASRSWLRLQKTIRTFRRVRKAYLSWRHYTQRCRSGPWITQTSRATRVRIQALAPALPSMVASR